MAFNKMHLKYILIKEKQKIKNKMYIKTVRNQSNYSYLMTFFFLDISRLAIFLLHAIKITDIFLT